MSVVSQEARRRWVAVACVVAAMVAIPIGIHAARATVPASSASPQQLLTKVVHSQDVPYSGLATSRGNLGLPDLPAAGDATAVLGGTTRSRAWWGGEQDWRISVITPTGEQSVYDQDGITYLWNYEGSQLTRVEGTPQLRLPRADDLLPPQAARRLLTGVGARDRVESIPGRRIAGATTAGICVLPGDPRSTIGHIDVWARPADGLPLAISITNATGVTALDSEFVELGGPPSPSVLAIPDYPGVHINDDPAPDLASRISRFSRVRMPDQLGGFSATTPVVSAAATYGSGLVRFVALPVPRRDAGSWTTAARSAASEDRFLTGGEALLISAGALNLVVAQADSGFTYALSGPVSSTILMDAARQLFTSPPFFRPS